MCNPVAIVGGISLATTIIGGITSAKAAQEQAEKDQAYYNHLADVAEENIGEVKQTAQYNKQAISDNAAREAQANKVQTNQLMGKQAVAVAANKIGGNSVTAMDIARDTINKSTLDEMYIRYQADTQKFLLTKEENAKIKALQEQAIGYRMGGEAAKTAGQNQVAATALSTAGQVANAYFNYKAAGKG